jgi:hypothetical protein
MSRKIHGEICSNSFFLFELRYFKKRPPARLVQGVFYAAQYGFSLTSAQGGLIQGAGCLVVAVTVSPGRAGAVVDDMAVAGQLSVRERECRKVAGGGVQLCSDWETDVRNAVACSA